MSLSSSSLLPHTSSRPRLSLAEEGPLLKRPRTSQPETASVQTSPEIEAACRQTLFSLIPSEWFLQPASWPAAIPSAWIEAVRESLEHQGTPIEDSHELAQLTLNAFIQIRQQAAECPRELSPVLAAKKPVDLDQVIRINLERHPRLDTASFVDFLFPLLVLLNRQSPSRHELELQVEFLKHTCKHMGRCDFFPLHPSDRFFIIILQLTASTAPISHDELMEVIAILDASFAPAALSELEQAIEDLEAFLSLPAETRSPFSRFLRRAFDRYGYFGKGSFVQILRMMHEDIPFFKHDMRPGRIIRANRSLLMKMPDLLAGIHPCFERMVSYVSVCSYLNALSPLTSHKQAVDLLIDKLFAGSLEPSVRSFALKLYQTWWFREHKRGRIVSMSERVIDWTMHQILVDEELWNLELNRAVELVRTLVQQRAPLLPFNSARAGRMFSELHLERRKRRVQESRDSSESSHPADIPQETTPDS